MYANCKDIQNRSKRIASNTLVLFARMLIITFVNLYTVRWVLAGLGTEDYGIFNAVAGVVTASTCISSVLALSTQRFYSFAMGKGESDRLKEIFSVSLNIVVMIALVLLVLFEIVGPWLISTQLTIPVERMEAAQWILQFSLFSFIFTLLQIPFIGAVFANENMGYYALISTIDCIVKLLIAYCIGITGGDDLVYYGAALMLEAFMVMMLYVIIARRKYPECKYTIVKKKKTLYKELFSFSGWSFYGALAGVGMTQGSTIILNVFFGPIINAAFGIANQIYNAINTLTNSIAIAFRPAMIKSYSAKENKYLEQLFFASSKAILYLLAMVLIPFIFEAETLLTLWLGECTPTMVLFARLYAVYTICLALHNPITTIIQATGNIRKYSMYVESMTILCLPVSWLLFKLGMPPYFVFVTMIGLCILAHIIRLLMLQSSISVFTISKYLVRLVLPGILIISITTLIVYCIETLHVNRIFQFLLSFAVSAISISILLYAVGISKKERTLIKELVNRKLKKIKQYGLHLIGIVSNHCYTLLLGRLY